MSDTLTVGGGERPRRRMNIGVCHACYRICDLRDGLCPECNGE